MKCARLSVVAILAVVFVACGDGGSGGGGSASPVGTYVLVKDKALMDSIGGIAAADSGMPPEMIKEMVAMMTLTAELKADKTFQVKGTMGPQGEFTGSGTWSLSGKNLTLTTTHQNGKKKETPDVQETVFEGSSIRLPKNEKDQPFEMVLKRQ